MTHEEAEAPNREPAARVFITGASGFIGRTLAERYRSLGSRVTGVDRAADDVAGVVAGDVASPGAWQQEMQDCDLVIHTAAVVSNVASLQESWELNVMGTRPGTYSIQKARQTLGYEPKVDLDEGMRHTEDWLQARNMV